MPPPGPYTSVYTLLRDWTQATLDQTMIRMPSNGLPPTNLPSILPVIIATRIGGIDVLPCDAANMVLDVYSGDVDTAEQIAEQLRTALLYRLPNYVVPDQSAWVKRVRTLSGPLPLPYDSTVIGRVSATYEITVRTAM